MVQDLILPCDNCKHCGTCGYLSSKDCEFWEGHDVIEARPECLEDDYLTKGAVIKC